MIVLEQSGGIAGIHEIWRFYGDGRVVWEDRQKGTRQQMELPADEVNNAVRQIVEGGFMDLAEKYMPANRCCDRFTYQLTVVYEGAVKTVATMDGAEQPPALADALAMVRMLIDQVQSMP